MGSQDRPGQRGIRLGQRLATTIGGEIREARIAAGLSRSTLGSPCRLSRGQVARVEAGHPSVRVVDIACLAAVLGLDASMRLYPGSDPLRDAAQSALLDRFRARLHPSWDWALEVPLPIPGDRRAWDGFVVGAGIRIGVEAETRLRDAQAVARRISLKQRDSGVDRVILLLAETHANAAALAIAREYLRALLPLDTRSTMRALAAGLDPGASSIVIL